MKKTSSLAPTEQRNPRSRDLDQKSIGQILRILNREDARVPAAVRREIPAIARAVQRTVEALRRGGRLLYVGAGTSGRLGVLDAAECPPTFGVPASKVVGIIAGGRPALARAVEGAEDSVAQGARDLAAHKLKPEDVVVGVSAGGSTPYVRGALGYARRRGATTVVLTANRRSPIAQLAEITIAPQVGPEAIAGSSRLKAGTAQKLVLNMLSTAAMVRLGYTYDHWMVNVALTNRKLRQRGVRILAEATGSSLAKAQQALRQARHDLRVALVMLKAGSRAAEARRRLQVAGGNLRKALAEAER